MVASELEPIHQRAQRRNARRWALLGTVAGVVAVCAVAVMNTRSNTANLVDKPNVSCHSANDCATLMRGSGFVSGYTPCRTGARAPGIVLTDVLALTVVYACHSSLLLCDGVVGTATGTVHGFDEGCQQDSFSAKVQEGK